jgi:probable rRNA maturation factor
MPVWFRTRLRHPVVHLPAIQTVSQRVLAVAGYPRAEVSLNFVSDRRMRHLNRQYRGHDCSTDVLAFAMRDAAGPPTILLGDVVISLPTAARQAVECGTSLDEEVVRLIIHGVLHLIGYDHERSEEEAERMRCKEKEIIRLLLPLPNLFQERKMTQTLK